MLSSILLWLRPFDDTAASPPPSRTSEILSDGTVTPDEYRSAVEDFVRCLEAVGLKVTGVRFDSTAQQWTYDDILLGSTIEEARRNKPKVERCYWTHLGPIDVRWLEQRRLSNEGTP